MTGHILFETPGASHEIGALPVRIRTSDGEVVETGVSGKPIEVPPGDYYVWVRLPNGRESGSGEPVTVTAGATIIAPPLRGAISAITPAPDDAEAPAPTAAAPDAAPAAAMMMADAPSLMSDAPSLMSDAPSLMSDAPSMAAAEPTIAAPAQLAPESSRVDMPAARSIDAWLWRGEWFAAWGSPDAPTMPDSTPATAAPVTLSTATPLIVPRGDNDQLLALPNRDGRRFVVVPFDQCTACIGETANVQEIDARLAFVGDDAVVTYHSTVVGATNALLELVDSASLTDMVMVSDDMIKQGESALIGAGGSVLRALIGGYVLLRANQTEGLRGWLDILAGRPPVLTDIAILRAELFARLGLHQEALNELGAAIAGPCPWFRSGLSYMAERVRFYLSVTDNDQHEFRIDDRDLPRFRLAHWRLGRMMPMLVTSRTLTTFDLPAAP